MKINRVDHIAIICSDYEKSKYFYTNILGFKIIREIWREERQSFKLDLALNGSYSIELFSFPNSPQRASYPEACGLRHLAFEVDSLEDAVLSLNKKDVRTEELRFDSIRGGRYTFFKDPDGLPIELYEKVNEPL